MKRMQVTALLALMLAGAGCFRVHYVDRTKQPTGQTFSEGRNWFGYGFGGSADLRVSTAKCGQAGVAKVSSSSGIFGVIIYPLTLGMWRHRTFEITCAGGQK